MTLGQVTKPLGERARKGHRVRGPTQAGHVQRKWEGWSLKPGHRGCKPDITGYLQLWDRLQPHSLPGQPVPKQIRTVPRRHPGLANPPQPHASAPKQFALEKIAQVTEILSLIHPTLKRKLQAKQHVAARSSKTGPLRQEIGSHTQRMTRRGSVFRAFVADKLAV